MNKTIFYASSVATGAPGIIHLYLFSIIIAHAVNIGIFFLIAGLLQLFWVLPTIRKWNRVWYYGGIGGTAILITIWSMTRLPNPITKIGLPITGLGIVEETFQAIFIGLTMISLILTRKESNSKIASSKTSTDI